MPPVLRSPSVAGRLCIPVVMAMCSTGGRHGSKKDPPDGTSDIWWSHDGGTTWTAGTVEGEPFSAHTTNQQRRDATGSLSQGTSPIRGPWTCMEASGDGQVVIAGHSEAEGVFVSNDGGKTWRHISQDELPRIGTGEFGRGLSRFKSCAVSHDVCPAGPIPDPVQNCLHGLVLTVTNVEQRQSSLDDCLERVYPRMAELDLCQGKHVLAFSMGLGVVVSRDDGATWEASRMRGKNGNIYYDATDPGYYTHSKRFTQFGNTVYYRATLYAIQISHDGRGIAALGDNQEDGVYLLTSYNSGWHFFAIGPGGRARGIGRAIDSVAREQKAWGREVPFVISPDMSTMAYVIAEPNRDIQQQNSFSSSAGGFYPEAGFYSKKIVYTTDSGGTWHEATYETRFSNPSRTYLNGAADSDGVCFVLQRFDNFIWTDDGLLAQIYVKSKERVPHMWDYTLQYIPRDGKYHEEKTQMINIKLGSVCFGAGDVMATSGACVTCPPGSEGGVYPQPPGAVAQCSGDADSDGVPTHAELSDDGAPRDTDGDSILDYLDPDDDGDTVPTAWELGKSSTARDADGDGTPDYLDPDDDEDGIPTKFERTGGRHRGGL